MNAADFLKTQKQILLLMPAMCRMDLEHFVDALERGKIAGGLPADYGILGDKMMGDVAKLLEVAQAALKFQRAIKFYRPDVAQAALEAKYTIPRL